MQSVHRGRAINLRIRPGDTFEQVSARSTEDRDFKRSFSRPAASWTLHNRCGAQVREDPLDHRLLQNGRNVLKRAAAVEAVLQVEVKHALEQLGPAQPHRAVKRAVRFALGDPFSSAAVAERS